MTRAVVAGAAGRMGRQIVAAVLASPEVELAGGFELPDHPAMGQDLGSLAGLEPIGLALVPSLDEAASNADVIIDFTLPEATMKNLAAAIKMGLCGVVGTTGLSPEQKNRIGELAQERPIVLAPNMSVGVNLLFKLAAEATEILGTDYDLEIVEAHHRMKKDAPSGTALRLAEVLAEARGKNIDQVGVFARHGIIGQRTDEEIGVQTIRAGDIVGEHTVIMAGPGERVELTHRAHTRANFAQGAIRAAAWVGGQPAGLYDMQDVLGLR